jgi:hypothetical protein
MFIFVDRFVKMHNICIFYDGLKIKDMNILVFLHLFSSYRIFRWKKIVNTYILWLQIYVEFINMDGSKGIATLICQQCSAWKSVYDLLINSTFINILYNQKRFTDTNLSTMQIIWYTSKSSFFACSLEFLFWQIYASEQCSIHIFANTLYALLA